MILRSFFSISVFAQDVVLQNNKGVKCVIVERSEGYAIGSLYLNSEQIEAPLTEGMIRFKNITNNQDYWFFASEKKIENNSKAIFSGRGSINGVTVQFTVTIETPPNTQSIRLIYDFSVNKDIKDWVASLQFHNDFNHTWRCHLYPWVMDSKWINRNPLNWMGIPSLFMYRDDRSFGLLWGIDPNSDYLNPTTWTRDFGLFFTDGIAPAQFHVGSDGLHENINYNCPMQIVLSDVANPDDLLIDLMDNWIILNNFKVPPLHVRSNDEALEMFIKARKNNTQGYIKGKGYSLHGNRELNDFLYMGVQGMAAYFDYMLYETTGDSMWRKRAFEQMDFILEGQETNLKSLNHGALHTTYSLSSELQKKYGPSPVGWNSDDRWNIGYKPDIAALCARYMLDMWKLVKTHEGIDRQDWYNSAINMINFCMRNMNEDGGLAQKVQIEPLEMRWHEPWGNIVITPIKFRSSTAGRALPSFWHFHKMTGDKRYYNFMLELEKYHLEIVQNKYYFTGHHPDLPPYEPTEASIWGVAEYWLNRFEETGDKEYLKHAEANAYLSILWATPKELSWVDNPTFGGSAEQQHYLSLVVYCYQNRKAECLKRISDFTGKQLWSEMYNRTIQNIYWTQQNSPEGVSGGTYERTSLPWPQTEKESERWEINSTGVYYFNEQALDLFLQTFSMYRTGYEKIYFGDDLTTKVYLDGTCYYSKDISGLVEMPFMVTPSSGSLVLKVNNWEDNNRSWTVTEVIDTPISIAVSVGHLNNNTWYSIKKNSKLYGDFQSNYRGELYFTDNSTTDKKITYELLIKN